MCKINHLPCYVVQLMPQHRTDPDIARDIRDLTLQGYAPRRVHDRIGQKYGERAPSLRTLYSIVGELRPPKGPGWSLANADPADAQLVIPVMATLLRNSEGRVGRLSVETARWVAIIRRVAPRMAAGSVYRWAIRYESAQAAGRDTRELDWELAADMEKPPRQE